MVDALSDIAGAAALLAGIAAVVFLAGLVLIIRLAVRAMERGGRFQAQLGTSRFGFSIALDPSRSHTMSRGRAASCNEDIAADQAPDIT